jgi:hypothetical protein
VLAGPFPQLTLHVAGSAHCTRQWPSAQSTSQAPLQTTSHFAAPSQLTWLASPTVAAQLAFTCWHEIVLLAPDVALHVCAFWQDAVAPSPPWSAHALSPFAQ